ncbi:MAG: hypothetical protein ACW99G_22840 [Candidatus Thorarchaeota archaeon]|jgi:hypothetical protein
MKLTSITFDVDGKELTFSRKDTYDTVVSKLGKPDDESVKLDVGEMPSLDEKGQQMKNGRKKRPTIIKYKELEFTFNEGHLIYVFQDRSEFVEFLACFDREY